MSNKKIIVSLSVLVLAGAIFFIANKMTAISPPEHRTKFFPALEERHITAFVISENNSKTRVERSDDGWNAGTDGDSLSKADNVLAQIAVERIVSLKKSEKVSDNPANQPKFEVDEREGGSYVEIYTADREKPAHTLRIGKSGPSWNSNYVRLDSENEVYLLPGDLRQALFFDLERWRAKEPEPLPEPEAEDADSNNAPEQ